MNKKIILNCLKNHLQEFKEKYNVEKIGLFGSYARDEATEKSDIDIFVKMPPKMFDRIAIKNLLQEELGKEVDIIREHKNIDSLLMEMIQKDIIYVNNTTPIEKQNLFKEHYNKKLQDIQNLKDNFIKNNSLSLKYITDRTAFKIPYNGVICDWHNVAMLYTNHYLLHPINIIGAETIFGNYGLYDCSEYFKSENRDIFELTGTNLCATPIRAILDILFENIYVLNRYPKKLEHFHDDYMMDEINYDELFQKITILRENFNDSQKAILDDFFEKELKDSKSVYSNEVVYDRKKDKKMQNKIYFGINIFENNLVKEDDIKKLPFYDFFRESMKGSTYLEKDGINYIYLKDWENFCNLFIETGKHRFSK